MVPIRCCLNRSSTNPGSKAASPFFRVCETATSLPRKRSSLGNRTAWRHPAWVAQAIQADAVMGPHDSDHAGETILVAKDGRPWARLVPLDTDRPRRQPGLLRGQLQLPPIDVLLAPLPPEELDALEAPLPS